MKQSSKILNHITILFKFDCCPDENFWQITERETGIIHRSRSYVGEDPHSLLEEKVHLRSDREYILTMYDKASNGLQEGDSYYEIYSGIADNGWIERALVGRVTGNFGFSLEHIIPMQYSPQIELVHFQNDVNSTQIQNTSDLFVMFSVFTTFLVFGFILGILFGQRDGDLKSNSKAEEAEPFSNWNVSRELQFTFDSDQWDANEENTRTIMEEDLELNVVVT